MRPTDPGGRRRSEESVTFFSTVHPHPWAPAKGTFNRALLSGLSELTSVSATVPVPWVERMRQSRRGLSLASTSYGVDFPVFWYLPKVSRHRLAAQMAASLRRTLERPPEGQSVLGYWADPDGSVGFAWARRHKRRFVQIVGGSDVMLLADNPDRYQRIRHTLLNADLLVAIGPRIAERVRDIGIEADRIRVFERGVDTTVFKRGSRTEARAALGLPHDRPILLWVGRMEPVKGLPTLISALRHPALHALDPFTVLVGSGSQERKIRGDSSDLIGSGALHMPGPVAHASLPTWYQAADLVVLPSLSEGVPNVLLEAAACGAHFVASDVGSIRELSEAPELELVPPANPSALAVAIARQLHGESPPPRDVVDLRTAASRFLQLLRD